MLKRTKKEPDAFWQNEIDNTKHAIYRCANKLAATEIDPESIEFSTIMETISNLREVIYSIRSFVEEK